MPALVLERLAGQLDIADPSCVKRYAERRTTPFEHRDEIKAAYGLREFTEAEDEFAQWVHVAGVEHRRRGRRPSSPTG